MQEASPRQVAQVYGQNVQSAPKVLSRHRQCSLAVITRLPSHGKHRPPGKRKSPFWQDRQVMGESWQVRQTWEQASQIPAAVL